MASLLWVIELEGDVASDLSVFHRIDDMYTMGSRRWSQLVLRLIAYQGAVQLRMKMEAEKFRKAEGAAPVALPAASSAPTGQAGGGGVLRAADGTELLPGPPSPWLQDQSRGKVTVVEATRGALVNSDIGDMFSFGTPG